MTLTTGTGEGTSDRGTGSEVAGGIGITTGTAGNSTRRAARSRYPGGESLPFL